VQSVLFAVIVCGALPVASANADDSETISSERRDAARRSFEQGEQAYNAGDFVQAAKSFDEAYHLAPHYAPLWNAARSWDRAGEQTRAANAYARYLRAAPADAPDRDAATQALAVLASKLGRIEVYATGADIVRVDDELLEGTSVYVHPGMHVVEGQMGTVLVRRTEMLEAGSVRSVALVEEPAKVETDALALAPVTRQNAPPTSLQSPLGRANGPLPSNQSRRWLGPAAIVAGGATVVTGALVLWSGLDTLSAREDFDAAPTHDKLAIGKDKQLRTNVLLGSMAGSGVIAGALASWWLWGEPNRKSALIVMPPVAGMPMNFVLAGSF
jgi:tetratricopeptide (TPR) repeat protein